jgi:hypothetical protein
MIRANGVEMNTVHEGTETAWRPFFRLAMEGAEGRIGYLQDPEMLQGRSSQYWLTNLLSNLRFAAHHLRVGGEKGEATEEDVQRLQRVRELAIQGVKENLGLVKERMQREFEARVRPYRSGKWPRAIESGHVGEMALMLFDRDAMEAHLRAPEWLHPELVPDPELVRVVEQMDAVLRAEGRRLSEFGPPILDDEVRACMHSREDWWWWLDQVGGEGTAAT